MGQMLTLHPRHAELKARFGEWEGRELVEDYGAPVEEYTAARHSVALLDFSFRDVLRLTGEDRIVFLHGMVSQDVKGLADGDLAFTTVLTAKGGMVADGRILRRPEDLLLLLEPGRGPVVKAFLERHLVSEDVEVTDVSADWTLLGLRGPATQRLLEGLLGKTFPSSRSAFSADLLGAAAWVLAAHEWSPGGVDLLQPAATADALLGALLEQGRSLQLRPSGMRAAEWLRVEAGVPRYGPDLDERTLPMEAGLERGLHFEKGCYIGQEVIARATYRGHLNRKLAGLLLGEATPPVRAELRAGERKAGWLGSVVRSPALGQNVALGYIHRDFLTPGTKLTVLDGGAGATVTSLPLVDALAWPTMDPRP